MSLLKVRAKILIKSEEDMEMEQTYDFGNIAKDPNWVWAYKAIPFEQIYQIDEYNNTKCILILDDDSRILVAGKFDELFEQWNQLRIKFGEFAKKDNEESEETSEEDED